MEQNKIEYYTDINLTGMTAKNIFTYYEKGKQIQINWQLPPPEAFPGDKRFECKIELRRRLQT